LPKSFNDPRKELPFQGVYHYSRDGKLTLLTKDIKAPNGIAFSPDEKKLYVSNALLMAKFCSTPRLGRKQKKASLME
jgi:sugar lactone lactonase YvrE